MGHRRRTLPTSTSDATGGNPSELSDVAMLRRAQEETDALLQAADDAINRALSHDPIEFLEQARQHGGE